MKIPKFWAKNIGKIDLDVPDIGRHFSKSKKISISEENFDMRRQLLTFAHIFFSNSQAMALQVAYAIS